MKTKIIGVITTGVALSALACFGNRMPPTFPSSLEEYRTKDSESITEKVQEASSNKSEMSNISIPSLRNLNKTLELDAKNIKRSGAGLRIVGKVSGSPSSQVVVTNLRNKEIITISDPKDEKYIRLVLVDGLTESISELVAKPITCVQYNMEEK